MFNARRLAMDSRSDKAVTRPTVCPFCKGKVIDTLAKVLTERTFWRCRTCEATWTIASLAR
jgi:ribosomal protein L37AE/L43A